MITVIAICFNVVQLANAAEFQKSTLQNGGDLISVVGDLSYGDEKTFINVALSSSNAVVVFQSRGGNLLAGIEIGKAIHLKGFSTLVPGNMQCASACALAWLGGRTRFMGNAARVGFHAVYTDNNGRADVSSAGNALVGAYLNQLGLPADAVIYITDTSPDAMQWLTFVDAQRYGIDVKPFVTSANAEPPSRSITSTAAVAPPQDQYASVAICFSLGLFGTRPCEPWSSGTGIGLSQAEADKQAWAACQHRLISSSDSLIGHQCQIVRSVKNGCLALAAGGGLTAVPWSVTSSSDISSAEMNALSECQQRPLSACAVVNSICATR